MKLTRDAMGNYSYQYVADQDAIAKAEEELAIAQNNLYNMEKDRTKSLVNEYYATWTEANQLISEAVANGDKERVARLQEYYNTLLTGIQAELGVSSDSFDVLGKNIANWQKPFEDFTAAVEIMNISELLGEDGSIATMVQELFGEQGTITNLQNTVATLLSEDGALYIATKSLEDSVLDANTLSEKSALLVAATQTVADNLPGRVTETKTLADNLDKYYTEYQAWLEEQTGLSLEQEEAIKAQTEATKKQTEATGKLIVSIDDLNGTMKNSNISIPFIFDNSPTYNNSNVDTDGVINMFANSPSLYPGFGNGNIPIPLPPIPNPIKK